MNKYSGEYVLPLNAEVQAMTNICEVNVYHEFYNLFFLFLLIIFLISGLQNVVVYHLSTDAYVYASLIQQGFMPCAPHSPTTAMTIHTLKLFCLTHLCCPHVMVHSFVKPFVICIVYHSSHTFFTNSPLPLISISVSKLLLTN